MTMAVHRSPPSTGAPKQGQRNRVDQPDSAGTVADMKARQAAKIRELGDALIACGIVTLDAQAEALGLSRSTTWTILKGNHKSSGLSGAIINRMLAAPQLPPLVRAKVLEYIEEKTAGLYGDCQPRLRKFVALLSTTAAGSANGSGIAAETTRIRKRRRPDIAGDQFPTKRSLSLRK
jgi:hypothetical protein